MLGCLNIKLGGAPWPTVMHYPVELREVTSGAALATIARTSPLLLCEVAFVCSATGAPGVACFHPVDCWPLPGGGMVFSPSKSFKGAVKQQIACGQCIGCRLDKAREWATRMSHEALQHEHNAFVTLTYSDDHLPADGSLSLRAGQLFLKRLRKEIAPTPVRFFLVGEYGDHTWRPHYHIILFGYAFAGDRIHWRTSPNGHPLFRSPQLERLWPYGHSEIGSLTPESAAYCARYALKKVSQQRREAGHYYRPHPVTGEFFHVIPEYAVMSRRPGIGGAWLDKYRSDCFPSGFVVIDGQKRPVPKYYVKRASLSEKEALKRVLVAKRTARAHAADNTPERLEAREELQAYRQSKIVRETNKV